MYLLGYIFEATSGNAEFRRQVSTPNVPKFATALVVLAEKNADEGVKVRNDVWVYAPRPYCLSYTPRIWPLVPSQG